jgi:ribosomal protein S18 acetylase RimI-like enzyme
MPEATIRPLVPTDLSDAAALLSLLNPDTPAAVVAGRLRTLLDDHSHYELIGAFISEKLVGIAGAWIATKIWCGRYLEIDNLVVHPAQRSAGIGARLIRHLENVAKDRGCQVVVLDSYTSNHPSHRLYHRLGFEIWGFHFIKPIGNWKGSESR